MSAPTHSANAFAPQIMAAIAHASSRRPVKALDVLALLGGKPDAFWAALDQLAKERQIASAVLYRPRKDASPWLAVWPTGVHLPPSRWTNAGLSALFVRHDPTAMFKAHAPRSRPRRKTKEAA